VVPNFIIQGGNSDNRDTPKKRSVIGSNYLLPSEVVPGRNHKYGTVSGAKEYRENPDKKTFPFEFFIFLGPIKHTKHLNGDYTIFARVIKGMDVVEMIANLPADKGEWPIDNVYINAEVID
jgi:peptidylprolyl isomerase